MTLDSWCTFKHHQTEKSQIPHCGCDATLLEKFWRISLYVTDDAIAKLYVTKSLVKKERNCRKFRRIRTAVDNSAIS